MASMNHWRKLLLLWLSVFTFLVGCQSDTTNNLVDPVVTSQEQVNENTDGLLGGIFGIVNRLLGTVIGLVTPQSGGTIHLLSSDFVVRPNAVSSSVHISWSISQQNPNGLYGGLNRVHDFGPEGLQFQVSSTLYVSYEDAGLGTNNPNLYRCYYYNEVTNNWEPQQTVVDATNRRFIVTINHFSRYAFGR